ncbi:hypothetical protein HAX54_033774, partial [Datura stramonium]|nr:hypothetical protein [Datura stramonium]
SLLHSKQATQKGVRRKKLQGLIKNASEAGVTYLLKENHGQSTTLRCFRSPKVEPILKDSKG